MATKGGFRLYRGKATVKKNRVEAMLGQALAKSLVDLTNKSD